MWVYEALAPRQIFVGALQLPEAIARQVRDIVDEGCLLHLGTSRSAGYGAASFSFCDADVLSATEADKPRADDGLVRLLAVSDILLPTGVTLHALLPQSVAGVRAVRRVWMRDDHVGGYFNHLQMFRDTQMTVAAGSVILAEVDETFTADALADGIGLRANEGWGEVAVLPRASRCSVAPVASDACDAPLSESAQQLVYEMLSDWLPRYARRRGFRDGLDLCDKNTRSFWGRMRQEIARAKTLEDFVLALARWRGKAREGLARIRSGRRGGLIQVLDRVVRGDDGGMVDQEALDKAVQWFRQAFSPASLDAGDRAVWVRLLGDATFDRAIEETDAILAYWRGWVDGALRSKMPIRADEEPRHGN